MYNGSCFDYGSDFVPTEELAQSDGDLTLFFLSTPGMVYTQPVDDDWYAAHRPFSHNISGASWSGQISGYVADNAAAVLGCKLQYQTCDPFTSPERGCSPWGGVNDRNYGNTTPNKEREGSVLDFWDKPTRQYYSDS